MQVQEPAPLFSLHTALEPQGDGVQGVGFSSDAVSIWKMFKWSKFTIKNEEIIIFIIISYGGKVEQSTAWKDLLWVHQGRNTLVYDSLCDTGHWIHKSQDKGLYIFDSYMLDRWNIHYCWCIQAGSLEVN